MDVQVDEHTVHTDQPRSLGGEETAPSPFDLFLDSVGGCAGVFVQGFCATRSIPYDDIRLVQRVRYAADGTPSTFELDILLPATFPEKYRAAIVRVVEQCSVKRALAAQPAFRVRTVAAHAETGAEGEAMSDVQP